MKFTPGEFAGCLKSRFIIAVTVSGRLVQGRSSLQEEAAAEDEGTKMQGFKGVHSSLLVLPFHPGLQIFMEFIQNTGLVRNFYRQIMGSYNKFANFGRLDKLGSKADLTNIFPSA